MAEHIDFLLWANIPNVGNIHISIFLILFAQQSE